MKKKRGASNYIDDLACGKGLEFPVVFLVGMEDEFSFCKNLTEGDEEETSIGYVGITRAEKSLFMTRAYSKLTLRENATLPRISFYAKKVMTNFSKRRRTISDSYYSSSFYQKSKLSQKFFCCNGWGLFDRYRNTNAQKNGVFTKKPHSSASIQRVKKPTPTSASTDGWTVGMKGIS